VSEIISQVAGERFDLYAHARLFAPLNMDSTFWQVPIERQNDLVKRYKPALAAAWFNSDQFMSRTTGCDGLKTTASDMLKFLQMLSRGGMDGGTPVLSPKSVECMTKNINKNLSLDSYFSAGFHLYDRFNAANGTKRSADSINHGGMGGAHILMDPQYGICAACFTVLNKDAAFHDFGAFYDALYECII
jgi:CubicO group peptidase (beta-lactamase class C family)